MRYSILVILVIASIGVGWFYILPAWGQIAALQETETQYDEALAQVQEFQRLRDSYVAQYASFPTEDIRRMNEMLPPEFDQLRTLMNIDAVAAEYGIEITGLEIERSRGGMQQEENTGALYQPHTVSFRFESDYETAVAFLEDLEGRLRILDITELNFTAPESGQIAEYNHDVTLQTYSVSDEAEESN